MIVDTLSTSLFIRFIDFLSRADDSYGTQLVADLRSWDPQRFMHTAVYLDTVKYSCRYCILYQIPSL